jgi:hypothetical protein
MRQASYAAMPLTRASATRGELEMAGPDLLLPDLERGAEWLLALVSA